MTIDHRIALGVNPNINFQPVRNALMDIRNRKVQDAELGMKNELFQQQKQINQNKIDQAEEARLDKSMVDGALEVNRHLDANDIGGAYLSLKNRKQRLMSEGRNTQDTDQALALIEQGPAGVKQLRAMTAQIESYGQKKGLIASNTSSLPSGIQEFNHLTDGLSEKDTAKAKRIELGLDPRAVGSAAMTTANTGQTQRIASSEAVIEGAKAGAKEAAKLSAQHKLKPEVESAVASAVGNAKASVEQLGEQRSNQRALEVYDTAMSGLAEALGATMTGPGVGWLPAMTSNQQIADGAVAAMAPVLKQLFRGAGEGTFTDKDQELLLKMVPTRNDSKAARIAKMQNIDAIVRAKLGTNATSQFGEGQIATNPKTGQKVIFRGGAWQNL